MDFYTVLDQVLALLRQRGRVSSGLKRQFDLDDDALADLQELLAHHPVADEDEGPGLDWCGWKHSRATPAGRARRQRNAPPEAERRQLTVLFCDLVDSTRLSRQLDPEDYREVVRAYQAAAAEVVQRFDGCLPSTWAMACWSILAIPRRMKMTRSGRASRLGDGAGIASANTRLRDEGLRLTRRMGIHTGAVDQWGALGGAGRQEQLALGDTPNLAARLRAGGTQW